MPASGVRALAQINEVCLLGINFSLNLPQNLFQRYEMTERYPLVLTLESGIDRGHGINRLCGNFPEW